MEKDKRRNRPSVGSSSLPVKIKECKPNGKSGIGNRSKRGPNGEATWRPSFWQMQVRQRQRREKAFLQQSLMANSCVPIESGGKEHSHKLHK